MDSANLNMLYNSDFLDSRSLPLEETPVPKLIWWTFAIIEIFLVSRLILEYFDINQTNSLSYLVHKVSYYILYPFTTFFTTSNTNNTNLLIIVAITSYFLLALTLINIIKRSKSPKSRIERARELSQRKYIR